ncbi:MAG TPA: DUF362 domain-containing protein, partial [Candidatus Methanoperedens sp.]
MSTQPLVYINDINEENLLDKIRHGLEFIRFNEIINENSTIFIKPNLTDAVHKPGITTTPLMIRTVIEAFSLLARKIYIGESDGGNYSYSADRSLRNHAIFDAASKFSNVEVVNLSKLPRTRVTEKICGKSVWVDLPDLLLNDIDCLVSVPVLKTHAMTHGTFSIKNLWGCYPDPMRLLYHKNLDYKLALISKLTKNRIQIVDGFWALDGHGPMEGTPVATNKILISNDPVAVDTSSAYLMNLDINKIGHLGIAEQFGLGVSDINKIQFNKDISKEKLQKFKPYKVNLDYFSVLLFKSELLSKLVLASSLTPLIYGVVNLTRTAERRTY